MQPRNPERATKQPNLSTSVTRELENLKNRAKAKATTENRIQ